MWPSKHKYDAFISHAVEDKLAIANELCARLEGAGLKIWYSGKELMVGDSLEKAIQKGLSQSRYGVVILSHKYLQKNWPIREFYMLLAKEIEHRKVILPILYNITMEELHERNMTMADKWAIPHDKGMDFVVQKLVAVIKDQGKKKTMWEWIEENSFGLAFWSGLLAILTLVTILILRSAGNYPPEVLIKTAIDNRINNLNNSVERETALIFDPDKLKMSSADQIGNIYSSFMNLKAKYRNEYEFDNGVRKIRARKNIESALKINLESLSPANQYNFSNPKAWMTTSQNQNQISNVKYSFINTQPVQYDIIREAENGFGQYVVTVSYHENLRVANVTLLFPDDKQRLKKRVVKFKGLFPHEKYTFERRGAEWVLATIE